MERKKRVRNQENQVEKYQFVSCSKKKTEETTHMMQFLSVGEIREPVTEYNRLCGRKCDSDPGGG